jgi:hypothetical protein
MVSSSCKRIIFPIAMLSPLIISTALFLTLFFYSLKFKLPEVGVTFFASVTAAMALSGWLLITGFWASIWGNPCAKQAIPIIYLVYGVILLLLGICGLALKQQILTAIKDYFDGHPGRQRGLFEQVFNCSWNATNTVLDCMNELSETYTQYGTGFCIGFIALFAILLIADVLTWKFDLNLTISSDGLLIPMFLYGEQDFLI